jgi:apolipoprotein N-acyltransferase
MSATVEPSNETPTLPAAPRQASSRTLALGLLGSLLCYLAHPPVGWSLLAWIGPAAWFYLARLPELPGRRPYLTLWLAGTLYWLAAVQWIRLPHELNIFGLFLLAAYLGVYIPLAVGLSRVAAFRLSLPLWLAAPIAWTGLEWIRARLMTGFLMASLAHTQLRFTPIIQIADVLGEYGVTFLIIMVASAIAAALPLRWIAAPGSAGGPASGSFDSTLTRRDPLAKPGADWRPLVAAILVFGAAFGYGMKRQVDLNVAAKGAKTAAIALIQSDMLADWKGTPGRDDAVMEQMAELSRQAVREHPGVDLVVWPETMFRMSYHHADDGYRPPQQNLVRPVGVMFSEAITYLSDLTRKLNAPILVGLDRVHWSPLPEGERPMDEQNFPFVYRQFNSSAAVDGSGVLVGTYDKMHLLPFGEYIPFVRWLPFLRNYSPITGGAQPGAGPAALEINGVVYSPNICYETVLPHLIRRQVADLSQQGKMPDVLVNLTNDAWYWGSSELDMHLASGVFRAVEMRTPLVVAANRGLSAHVDHMGQIVAATDRDVPAALVATVSLPPRGDSRYPSLFAAYGDWFALACLVCCIVLAVVGWRDRRAKRIVRRE